MRQAIFYKISKFDFNFLQSLVTLVSYVSTKEMPNNIFSLDLEYKLVEIWRAA
jgi:hypothetical protein